MKKRIFIPESLDRLGESLGGVFTQMDLAHMMGVPPGSTLQSRLSQLIRDGFLFRAKRGVYYTNRARLDVLGLRIAKQGYVSLATAMAHYGLVGTSPRRVVDILSSQGRPQQIETTLGLVRIHVQSEAVHFGYLQENDVCIASPEKAWIDCCYYHLRGVAIPFHLHADVEWSLLDKTVLLEMLSKYQNPKFVRFAQNLLEEG